MANRISEKKLVDVLVCFLKREFFVARELRHYEKLIDIVAIPHHRREVWAIEAKVSDWSRAIRQATVNLAAADRSYIAIQSKFAHRVPQEELRSSGIGLIAVSGVWGDVRILQKAQRSPFVNRLMNKRIKNQLVHGGPR